MSSRSTIATASRFRLASLLILLCSLCTGTASAELSSHALARMRTLDPGTTLVTASTISALDRQPDGNQDESEVDIGKRRRGADELIPISNAPAAPLLHASLAAIPAFAASPAPLCRIVVDTPAAISIPVLVSRLSACRGRAPPLA